MVENRVKLAINSSTTPYTGLKKSGTLGNPNFTGFVLCDSCGGGNCSGGGSDISIVA